MAEVVHRAVFDNVSAPSDNVEIVTSFGTVRLLSGGRCHGCGRGPRALQALQRWPPAPARETSGTGVGDPCRQIDLRRHAPSTFSKPTSGRSHALKSLLDKTWPTITASGALRRLFGNKPLLNRATDGLLDPQGAASLARPAAKRVDEQRWSRADLALLDEAEALISGVRQTYGHIVVDEAQDLSAMELRMIARRSRRGSITALGDLAQTTSPAGQTDVGAGDTRPRRTRGGAGRVDYRLPGARADHDFCQPPPPVCRSRCASAYFSAPRWPGPQDRAGRPGPTGHRGDRGGFVRRLNLASYRHSHARIHAQRHPRRPRTGSRRVR